MAWSSLGLVVTMVDDVEVKNTILAADVPRSLPALGRALSEATPRACNMQVFQKLWSMSRNPFKLIGQSDP